MSNVTQPNATTLPPLSDAQKQAGRRLRGMWNTIEREHANMFYRNAGIAACATLVGFVLAAVTSAGWLIWLTGVAGIAYYLYASIPAHLRKRVYDRHMALVWDANGLARGYSDLMGSWGDEKFQQFLTTYAWEDDEALWGLLAGAMLAVDAGERLLAFRNDVVPAFQAKKHEIEAALIASAQQATA